MSRVSKLAQSLYDGNFDMAVQIHKKDRNPSHALSEPEEVKLLLAKAYFISGEYEQAMQWARNIKDSRDIAICYQARMLLYKASYLNNSDKSNALDTLRERIQKEVKDMRDVKVLLAQINELSSATLRVHHSGTRSILGKTVNLTDERGQFQNLLKTQDDNTVVMEGIPMFLISNKWFQAWQQFTSPNEKITLQRRHPGPITQFEIMDHPFRYFHDDNPNKEYTNRYILNGSGYRILPKKCWMFLKERYNGIDLRRFNISFVDKPYQIMTEIFLKTIQIGRYKENVTGHPSFISVQITRKENWQGLKNKLSGSWNKGIICEWVNGKAGKKVVQADILEQVDTVGKQYVFITDRKQTAEVKPQKCGYPQCGQTRNLKFCQCKTIKYCGMDCLRSNLKNHKKKCELELSYQKQQGAVFKNFNLEQRDYGGRRGLVGLKNLGNTCYMNSGLQCMSNTRQITEFFMKDEFKNHINYNNPLGTKGNLACAYAQLMREMWTGNSDVVSPFKLKKMMGNLSAQFQGYGQQDSQEFISYLVDGLQEDLNLVRKKENFETSDDVKPDEEMSRQSEANYAKRVQSHIRSIMAGQFKSTVVCGSCKRVSVCFDPYLLVSLPIPGNQEWSFYFVPSDLTRGAVRFEFEFSVASTTLAQVAAKLTVSYNQKISYTRKKEENLRQDRLLFCILHQQRFQIIKYLEGNQLISSIKSSNHLFCFQVPASAPEDELYFTQFIWKQQIISFPRFIRLPMQATDQQKESIIVSSVERGVDKSYRPTFQDRFETEKIITNNKRWKDLKLFCKSKFKLLTYAESYKENFRGKLIEIEERSLSIEDCLNNYSVKERLEKDNAWYCSKCKDFREATKQMEIYKGNKILVLAFKRFSRVRKIRTPIKFPIQGLDMGPYFLSNKSRKSVIYDLYGVVNHFGSLTGGHYTAYCQNYLNKKWYEFNDSRVSQIRRGDIVSGDSYVLFLRRRD